MPSKIGNRLSIPTAALAIAALFALGGHRPAAAAGPIALPLVLAAAGPAPAPTALPTPSPLPLVTWSTVLAEVPVFPDARLAFFEARAADSPATAMALYDPPPRLPGPVVVAAWYAERLPAFGWTRVGQDAGGVRWARADGGWLVVHYGTGAEGVLRLTLRRDLAGARPPGATALVAAVPLPDGARRLRYDSADVLAEELAVARPAPATRLLLERRLAAAGWHETQVIAAGATTYLRFERQGAPLLLGVRATAPEASTVALGESSCVPLAWSTDAAAARTRSIYLAGVPVPPGLRLAGFDWSVADAQARERWQGDCLDLDVARASFATLLVEDGWTDRGDLQLRLPGRFSASFAAADGSPDLVLAAQAGGTGQLLVTLQRAEAGRQLPQRASLLWPDVPLPWGAEAWRLSGPTSDDWPLRETYGFPAGLAASIAAWYRAQLAETSWRFLRTDPAGSGPDQVYGGDGEELLVTFDLAAAPSVSLSRRRVCASDVPVLPPAEGRPTRWLAEMLIYPGAEYDGFDAPEERYRARCAGTAVVADWYRVMLERGNWVLVSAEWPNDPDRRRLRFARPGEQGWPPERRTAWAEVLVERTWPYTFRISLRRDPSGVVPLRSGP